MYPRCHQYLGGKWRSYSCAKPRNRIPSNIDVERGGYVSRFLSRFRKSCPCFSEVLYRSGGNALRHGNSSRLIVTVELLQRSVAVELAEYQLEKARNS